MIDRILKTVGVVVGLFLIGSSNYILNMVVQGQAMDISYGVGLYMIAGITYLFGLVLLGAAYVLSSGRRDVLLGISLVIAGLLHYYPIVNALFTDVTLIFLWSIQFSFSILMSFLLFYLAYRKLRRRLVEISAYSYAEY